MSKVASTFLATSGSLLVALVVAGTVLVGGTAATVSDSVSNEVADPAPTTTTTPTQDGHPWYG